MSFALGLFCGIVLTVGASVLLRLIDDQP